MTKKNGFLPFLFSFVSIFYLSISSVLLFIALTEENHQNKVKALDNMDTTEGSISVYPTVRGTSLFKISLINDSGEDCCIFFDGWAQILKNHKGQKAQIHWQYFENIDKRFGFKVVILDEVKENKELMGYSNLKKDYKRWEAKSYKTSLLTVSAFMFIYWGFLYIKRR